VIRLSRAERNLDPSQEGGVDCARSSAWSKGSLAACRRMGTIRHTVSIGQSFFISHPSYSHRLLGPACCYTGVASAPRPSPSPCGAMATNGAAGGPSTPATGSSLAAGGGGSGGAAGAVSYPPPSATSSELPAFELPPNVRLHPPTAQIRALMTIIRSAETSRADWIFSADRVIRLIVEFGMSPAAALSGVAVQAGRGASCLHQLHAAGWFCLPLVR